MSSQQQEGEKVSQSATPRNNPGGKALRPQQQQNSSKQDKRGDRSSGNRQAKPSHNQPCHNQPSHNQSAAQSGGAKIPHKKPPPAGATNSQTNGFDKSRIRQESISPTVCIICCCESDLFSIGMCGHPVCLECGTRIRVLGKNNLCSHCRLDLPEVYFVPYAGSWDDWVPPHNCINDRHGAQYGIKFGNKDALNAFSDYLAHVCTVCPKEPSFPTFQELKQHMSRQHDLYYCDLCVEHLQLYSWERKCYSRKELDTHRRLGDGDDKSHRGHPDCKFCNSRFLDHDHLYRHLRRDHFYCQLCDADGDSNTFYCAYEELKHHYKERHFLCEEGRCKEASHIVFRTEIDFKGHLAKEHKGGGRQTIQLDFNFSDRVLGHHSHQHGAHRGSTGRGRGAQGGGRGGQQQNSSRPPRQEPEPSSSAEPLPAEDIVIDVNDPSVGSSKIRSVVRVPSAQVQPRSNFEMQREEFPSLGGNSRRSAANSASNVYQNRGGFRRSDSLERDNFPALGPNVDARRSIPPVHSAPRLSSLAGGPQRSQQRETQRTFGVIDDDENFPSFTVSNQIAEQMKREAAAKAKREEGDAAKGQQQQQQQAQPTSLFHSLTSGNWAQRPTSLSQAAMCIAGDDDFPTLAGGPGKNKKREAAASGLTKKSAWAKGYPTQSAIVGCTVNSSGDARKNGDLPTPDIWPKTLKIEKPTEEEIKEAARLKTPPAVGKMLKLESNAKTKARRVAQQKQRHSEDASSSLREDQAAGVDENANARRAVEKPPGFGDDDSAAPPSFPPGYEEAVGPPPGLTVRSPSLIAVEHRYDRPHNFDDRNRLLFKTLDHRLSAVQLDKFKAVSGAFRKGERDADEYLAEISALLGERLAETLPELICLLPDIQRQRDLLQAYEKFADHHAGARPKKSWNPASTDFTVKVVRAFRFRLCPTCGQVLTDVDFNPHLGTHHLQDEFPTLES